MKIVTLIENTALRDDLTAEHGLSLYIETEKHRILFDAGQSGAFADNAEKLGVDLSKVDICILSHGHYDHGGGLERFMEINDHAPIYLNRHVFGEYYNAQGKFIGLPPLPFSDRFVFTDDLHIVDETLSLHTCNPWPRTHVTDPFGLTMVQQGKQQPDDFRHEQYLLLLEGEKRVLVSGCSHKDVLNLQLWFRPDVLIGGFHTMKMALDGPDGVKLDAMAAQLMKSPTRHFTGHCTGEAQYAFLKERMGEQLQALHTGSAFEV